MKPISLAMFAGAAVAVPVPATAQIGTGFVYQGALRHSGQVVNGTADFQFRLFGSSGGSVQIGTTQSVDAVAVVDGRFTLPLDFGPGIFGGDERYLEVSVRAPASTGNFVILTPRQRLAPAHYAHSMPGRDGHSLNAVGGSPVDSVFVGDAGGVGMGTTNPAGVLDVRSGSNSYVRVDGVNGDLHVNGGADRVAGIFNDSTGLEARTDIIVNNWPQIVINAGGGVGIGTLSPLRRLTVSDSGLWTARFEGTNPSHSDFEFAHTGINPPWSLTIYGAENPWGMPVGLLSFGFNLNPLCIAPNSWVGAGTVTPDFRLDLPNASWAYGRARANAWVTFSSARWKDNVHTLEDALDKVMHLRAVTFDWKPENGGERDIGFVAEEVGRVVPELVSWEADGQWAQGLAYDRITALAVEAIKQQQRTLESLRRDNGELAALIQRLEGLVAAREAALTPPR